MRKYALSAMLAAASLGLAACGDTGGNNAAADENGADAVSAAGGTDTGDANAAGGATASASFPEGARIVQENGATFRIDPDGTRVQLTDADSRIVVENGVRFRVDPDGARVRIDEQGATIRLGDGDGEVDADLRVGDDPSLQVSTNEQ